MLNLEFTLKNISESSESFQYTLLLSCKASVLCSDKIDFELENLVTGQNVDDSINQLLINMLEKCTHLSNVNGIKINDINEAWDYNDDCPVLVIPELANPDTEMNPLVYYGFNDWGDAYSISWNDLKRKLRASILNLENWHFTKDYRNKNGLWNFEFLL